MKKILTGWEFIDEVARGEIKFLKEYEPHKLPWNDREFFQNHIETIQLKNDKRFF